MRRQQIIRTVSLDRHVHAQAYAALVLSGGYEEAGDIGRFNVGPGDVVFHDRFEAHLDRFGENGAVVLNFRLAHERYDVPGTARVADPDCIVRLAEKDCRDAFDLLSSTAIRWTPQPCDWPDDLAAALMENPSLRLSQWAAAHGLAPWHVSRRFAQVFGVSPEVFRARARVRRVLRSIQTTQKPLAVIAAELGFSDQPHMTRSVRQLTGISPQVWRSFSALLPPRAASTSSR